MCSATLILNKEYFWKCWISVLQTSNQKCSSQTRQNDTFGAVMDAENGFSCYHLPCSFNERLGQMHS